MTPAIRRLGSGDIPLMRQLLGVFAEAFEEPETYLADQPDDVYLTELLSSRTFAAIVAISGDSVVGGLAGYLLPKFEQRRTEFYIYDLAVLESHRRQGIATRLIQEVRATARELGAWVIYVQADYVDEPAVALYSKLGSREEVLHFDIAPADSHGAAEGSGP